MDVGADSSEEEHIHSLCKELYTTYFFEFVFAVGSLTRALRRERESLLPGL